MDAFEATEEAVFTGKSTAELSFDAYQARATETAVYPGQGSFQGLAYVALGLNGEAGETAEQVKKTWRDEGVEDISAAVKSLIDEIEHMLKSSTMTHADVIFKAHLWGQKIGQIELTEERRQKLLKELGDTLWYAAQIATELNVNLGDVAQANLDKLAARRESDLIHGEGSDR